MEFIENIKGGANIYNKDYSKILQKSKISVEQAGDIILYLFLNEINLIYDAFLLLKEG